MHNLPLELQFADSAPPFGLNAPISGVFVGNKHQDKRSFSGMKFYYYNNHKVIHTGLRFALAQWVCN
jgi:hypothetical protein